MSIMLGELIPPRAKVAVTRSYVRLANVVRALIVCGLFSLFVLAFYGSVSIVRHCYTDFPVHDVFRAIIDYHSYTNGDLSVFLVPHGDHRIIFPELLFALDALAFHFQQYSLIALAFALQGWIAILLWRAFCRTVCPQRFVSLAAFFLTASILFSRETGVSFVWPILLGWLLAPWSTLLAINFIQRVPSAKGRSPLLASIALGYVATFSIGSGMVIWPVLVATALLVRVSLSRTLILLVSGAAAILLYLRGMHVASGTLTGLLAHPAYTSLFILEFLGMPISVAYPIAGRIASGLSLLSLSGMFFLAIRKHVIRRTPILSLFGICAAVVLTALLTAAGRQDLADNLLGARQIRYLSCPLIYWASFSLLVVWVLRTFQAGQLAALAFLVAFGVLFAGVSSHIHKWVRNEEFSFERAHFSTIALECGVFDSATIQEGILSNPEVIRSDIPYLRAKRLAFFSRSETYWIGKPIDSVFHLAHPAEVQFQNLRVNQFGNGYMVIGILRGVSRDPINAQVVFTDHAGRIVGLGEIMQGEFVASLISGADFRTPVLVGFLNPGSVISTARSYIVWSDHEATPVRTAISINAERGPICGNSSFESATLSPWVIGSGSVFIGAGARTGAHCLTMRSQPVPSLLFQDVKDIVPLHVYTVTAWVRATSGSSGKAQLWVHDTLGKNAALAEMNPTAQWQQVSVPFTGTKSDELRIHLVQPPGSPQTLEWDDVSVRP